MNISLAGRDVEWPVGPCRGPSSRAARMQAFGPWINGARMGAQQRIKGDRPGPGSESAPSPARPARTGVRLARGGLAAAGFAGAGRAGRPSRTERLPRGAGGDAGPVDGGWVGLVVDKEEGEAAAKRVLGVAVARRVAAGSVTKIRAAGQAMAAHPQVGVLRWKDGKRGRTSPDHRRGRVWCWHAGDGAPAERRRGGKRTFRPRRGAESVTCIRFRGWAGGVISLRHAAVRHGFRLNPASRQPLPWSGIP